jgi:hypothetical protein
MLCLHASQQLALLVELLAASCLHQYGNGHTLGALSSAWKCISQVT